MILDARQGFQGLVVDLDTGEVLRDILWLDTDRGVLEKYQTDAQGRKIAGMDRDGVAAWKTVILKGRFRVTLRQSRKSVLMGAPQCARCPSPLTLPGDDLCPACKARDRGKPLQYERIDDPLSLHKCCNCSRQAVWSVGDEIAVTPALEGKQLYTRAMTVGRRWYCDWCFRPPRLLDARGEPITDLGGIRPE